MPADSNLKNPKKDMSMLREMAREKAIEKLNARLQEKGIVPSPAFEPQSECSCYYEVLNATFDAPPTGAGVTFEFHSSTYCDVTDPTSCVHFTGLSDTEDPPCYTTIPGCVDEWQNFPPPPGLEPFNCNIPTYSSFDAYMVCNTHVPVCNPVDYQPASITFRVMCLERCGDDAPYTFSEEYSNPITLIFDDNGNGNWFTNYSAIIDLKGCGCEPHLVSNSLD